MFGLRLRQTEGLLASVLQLMGLDLAVPDHTTLSRRASISRLPGRRQGRRFPGDGPVHVLIDSTGLEIHGAGQWLEEKHGARSRRSWRKLHLVLDADSGEIIAHVMTDQDTGDSSQVEPLLDQIDGEIGQCTADGAYDGKPTYKAVTNHSGSATIVIPPRANAIERADTEPLSQRDRHIAAINTDGRMKWQAATSYGKRSLVEIAIGRYKSIIGRRLRARSFRTQQTEVAIGCAVLKSNVDMRAPEVCPVQGGHGITHGIKDRNPSAPRSTHQDPAYAIVFLALVSPPTKFFIPYQIRLEAMKEATKARLEDLLARSAEKDREIADRKRRATEEADRKAAEQKGAEAAWEPMLSHASKAATAVNNFIHTQGLLLDIGETKASDNFLRSAQIAVTENTKPTGRRIMLHLSKSGSVRPVFLLPYTGKSKEFSIFDADEDFFENLYIDFLDQVDCPQKSEDLSRQVHEARRQLSLCP